jgi:hypothetical protein
MERLMNGVQSQISQIFPNPPPARQIYICPCDSIDELADKVDPTQPISVYSLPWTLVK